MIKLSAMLGDAASGLFSKPATQAYPAERHEAPTRYRGQLKWDSTLCTGCGLCQKDCPAGAIEIEVIDRKAKQFRFTYRVDRCMFCAQCAVNCRPQALTMSDDTWEIAALSREAFTLQLGVEPDVVP